MYVMLVTMPWAALDTPPLALGILHGIVRDCRAEVDTLCVNLDFYDWAQRAAGLTVEEYEFFSTGSYMDGYGDWVFSGALNGISEARIREFTGDMAAGLAEHLREACVRLHRLVPRFVAELARRIVDAAPDVVGFTTTFQQNTASLAAARKIKMLAPGVTTVFGGANCDGAQGEALHRNFPQVDYVVRGEGERAVPALLEVVRGEREPAGIPGLCWRTGDGAHRANAMSRATLPAEQLRAPDFDAYFTRVEVSSARQYIEPRLVLEGSRGCWWGEKHHCTFCGLNGSVMEFRSRDPDAFHREVIAQAQRHQVLDVLLADNILDMGYFQSLLPALRETGYDFRFHCEVKANLSARQLRLLADAGLVQLQAGIESLSSRVLRLMDKGVTGPQNLRCLRDAQPAGVWVTWNYLYGFPGETDGDYDSIIGQVPALHHLAPPEITSRVAIERFSPYFDQPRLGFAELRPAGHYTHCYELPETELRDLAYLFDAPPAGIGEATAARLADCVDRWRAAHDESRFTHCDLDQRIVLVNRRAQFDWTTRTIDDPVEVATFRMLADPRTVPALARRLSTAFETLVPETRIARLLERWRDAGIVFVDEDRFVHVAPPATNAELTRVTARATPRVPPAVPHPSGGGDRALPPESGPDPVLRLWRDYDDQALRLPGMYVGSAEVTGGAAATADRYHRSGVRRVELSGVVDLAAVADPEAAVRALDLVRELTAWGIVVDWRVRLAAAASWTDLSHLYPPAEIEAVVGAEEARRQWLDGFFLGRCHYRRGPGFVEIRDHRRGVLNRIVIDDPAYLAAVDVLVNGAGGETVPDEVLGDLVAESLCLPVGDRHWWAAYRPHRWPQPPFHV